MGAISNEAQTALDTIFTGANNLATLAKSVATGPVAAEIEALLPSAGAAFTGLATIAGDATGLFAVVNAALTIAKIAETLGAKPQDFGDPNDALNQARHTIEEIN